MLSKQTTVVNQLVLTADGAELHLERFRSVRPDRTVQGVAAIVLVGLLSLLLPPALGEIALILQLLSWVAMLVLGVIALAVHRQAPKPWLLELHQGKLRQQGLAGPREYALVNLSKLVQFHDRLVLYDYDGGIASLPVPPSAPARRFLLLVRQQHAIAQETRVLTMAGREQVQALLQREQGP